MAKEIFQQIERLIMNKVILLGNVGKDPELKDDSFKLVKFPIATSERYVKDGEKVEKTEWHNVVFFGNQADVIAKYVEKGTKLLVEGRIQTRTYEKDGEKRYSTEIVGTNFEFVGRSEGSDSAPAQSKPKKKKAPKVSQKVDEDFDDEIDF